MDDTRSGTWLTYSVYGLFRLFRRQECHGSRVSSLRSNSCSSTYLFLVKFYTIHTSFVVFGTSVSLTVHPLSRLIFHKSHVTKGLGDLRRLPEEDVTHLISVPTLTRMSHSRIRRSLYHPCVTKIKVFVYTGVSSLLTSS